jgi:hypothetical protein
MTSLPDILARTSDAREDKLPRWARQHIAQLRMALADSRESVAAYRNEVGQSRIWHGDYKNRVYVPEPHGIQTVHFSPAGTDELYDDVQVRITGDAVEVNGGDSLHLELVSSNLFYVRTRSAAGR